MSRGALRDVCYGKNPPFSKHSRALLSMRTSFQTYYAQPPNIEGGNREETNFRIFCESAKKLFFANSVLYQKHSLNPTILDPKDTAP